MKTISIVNGGTKRTLYITVTSLYLIISTVFLINTEYQYRQTKSVLVEETLKNSTICIKQSFHQIENSFDQIFTLISTNPDLHKVLLLEDYPNLPTCLVPALSSQTFLQNTIFAILDSNGVELYSTASTLIKDLQKNGIILENSPQKERIIGFGNQEILYLRYYQLESSDKMYQIVLGISDEDWMPAQSFFSNIIPFILIDNKENSIHEVAQNKFIENNYQRHDVIEGLAKNIQFDGLISGKTLRAYDRFYVLFDATEQLFHTKENIAKLLFALDITNYRQNYRSHLIRLLVFILLLFVFVLLTVRLFYNQIINTMLRLEKKMEIKINARTRRLIDYNEQLNQIFNSTANGIRIVDKNFNVINANISFGVLSGINISNIVGGKCYNVFPSNSCHTTNCPLEQVKQGICLVQKKEIRFNQLGKKIICQYKAKPFLTHDGEIIGIIEDFKDITDLHIAQEEVHETQKQFETLLDSMPVGVFIRDFDGNMFYQNPYMNKVFGPVEEGRKNLKNIYPDLVSRFFEEDKMVEKYGVFVGEEKLVDNNGVERTYVTHKFKFNGIHNKALIGGVSIDITKRKNAEHNSYVLTKAIVNSPIGVLITSPCGVVEFCNPEFEKYSGEASEGILGNVFPYFNPSRVNKLQASIEVALNGGIFQGELHLTLYNNTSQWYSLSIAPVFNREGRVAHLIFVFDNTNERKEYESQIEIAKTKAEESDRLKTAFLSNLSHEIRTPLNAILGFSSLLNTPTISLEDKSEIPAFLLSHSNKLLDLIDDLIDIASIETNQLIINQSECQLNKLLLDTFNDVVSKNQVLKEKKIKINIKLGIIEESFTVLTDPKRLAQVVSQLLSNAIKFTNSGFVEFGYTMKDTNNLLFYVIDTGIGFTEEEKNIIFNPFRQADDSRTRSFNGLGLGLAISKHIIDRLGGKIWVNSTKNQGSTFYFTLPYIPIKTKFDLVVLPPKHKGFFNWNQKTILVADDIDSNYKFIQTLLKPTGARLLWAKNGREAVDTVQNQKVDVILMDIVMPEIDGFEATRQIKKIDSNIKIICQTAYPSTEHQLESEQCGMDSFLSKPIAAFSMLKAIDELISCN